MASRLSKSNRVLFGSPERRSTPVGGTAPCFEWNCFFAAAEQEVGDKTSSPTTSEGSSSVDRKKTRLKGRKLRICVVEHNKTNLMIATRVLQTYDFLDDNLEDGFEKHEITQAKSGFGALGLMQRMSFDIVFFAEDCPDVDGLAAVKAQRSYEASVTAVVPQVIVGMLEADEGHNTRGTRAVEAGMDMFMRKPFTIDRYNEVLDELDGRC